MTTTYLSRWLFALLCGLVQQRAHVAGKATFDVRALRPGTYVVELSDGQHPPLRQRTIIK